MERNVKICIEQFDNGISAKCQDMSKDVDDSNWVAYGEDIDEKLGHEIMSDIRYLMDLSAQNIIQLEIKYSTPNEV